MMTPDEPKEARKPKEPLLRGLDNALFFAGVICLVLGLLSLLVMVSTIYGDFFGDFLTFDGALEAVGASLGAVATTFAAIGSALLFVVSLRVQARELRHSIVELKSSVEAQSDAAVSFPEVRPIILGVDPLLRPAGRRSGSAGPGLHSTPSSHEEEQIHRTSDRCHTQAA